MNVFKIIFKAAIVLLIVLIGVLHLADNLMSYNTLDIIDLLPEASISFDTFGDVDARVIHLDNQADTTLIFVHGAPGSFSAFNSYLEDSAWYRYNLIAYDRPGYGASSSSPMPGIEEQANILLNIINKYASKTNIAIGHSYGGPIAAYTAILAPEVLVKAVMIAPLLDPEHEPLFWYSYIAKWPLTRSVLTNDLKTAGTEKFDHASSLRRIESHWKHLSVPILHIHGAKDGLAPPQYNTDYSQKMIDSKYLELQYYPDEGHLILWENSELIQKAIFEFVQSNGSHKN